MSQRRTAHPPAADRSPLRQACLALACLLPVTACQQTAAPVAELAPQRVALDLRRDYKGCSETIAAKSEYQPLARKLALASSHPSASRYSSWAANVVSPRQREIELLTALRDDLQACRKIALDDAAARPADRKALAAAFTADDQTWTEALAGRLTWGALNGRLRTAAMRLQADLAQADATPARQAAMPTTDATPAKPALTDKKKIDIDVGYRPNPALPEWANTWNDREGRAYRGVPGRSSYCERMPGSAYCSLR